jgi:hypothetical protein
MYCELDAAAPGPCVLQSPTVSGSDNLGFSCVEVAASSDNIVFELTAISGAATSVSRKVTLQYAEFLSPALHAFLFQQHPKSFIAYGTIFKHVLSFYVLQGVMLAAVFALWHLQRSFIKSFICLTCFFFYVLVNK